MDCVDIVNSKGFVTKIQGAHSTALLHLQKISASRLTINPSELLDIALALSIVVQAPMEVLGKHDRNGEVMVHGFLNKISKTW